MEITIGKRKLTMGGKYVTELRSSNDIMDNLDALRSRMKEDGYLLIRGFHSRDKVLAAQKDALQKLMNSGSLSEDYPMEQGIVGPNGKSAFWGGTGEDMPALLELVNSPSVMEFFDRFLGDESLTYDFKWARAVGNGDFTGAHYDIVYMGRGTKNLYTVWTPLGDISYDKGGLALCLGSPHFDKIKQTYGQMDVDRDHVTGWFSNDPVEIIDVFGGQWATTEFQAGDAIIFGMYMMHCSLTNTTNEYRISVDTRYQLRSEPIDERWIGRKPKAHYAWTEGATVPMEDARASWGV